MKYPTSRSPGVTFSASGKVNGVGRATLVRNRNLDNGYPPISKTLLFTSHQSLGISFNGTYFFTVNNVGGLSRQTPGSVTSAWSNVTLPATLFNVTSNHVRASGGYIAYCDTSGYVRYSSDNGDTWSQSQLLPSGVTTWQSPLYDLVSNRWYVWRLASLTVYIAYADTLDGVWTEFGQSAVLPTGCSGMWVRDGYIHIESYYNQYKWSKLEGNTLSWQNHTNCLNGSGGNMVMGEFKEGIVCLNRNIQNTASFSNGNTNVRYSPKYSDSYPHSVPLSPFIVEVKQDTAGQFHLRKGFSGSAKDLASVVDWGSGNAMNSFSVSYGNGVYVACHRNENNMYYFNEPTRLARTVTY